MVARHSLALSWPLVLGLALALGAPAAQAEVHYYDMDTAQTQLPGWSVGRPWSFNLDPGGGNSGQSRPYHQVGFLSPGVDGAGSYLAAWKPGGYARWMIFSAPALVRVAYGPSLQPPSGIDPLAWTSVGGAFRVTWGAEPTPAPPVGFAGVINSSWELYGTSPDGAQSERVGPSEPGPDRVFVLWDQGVTSGTWYALSVAIAPIDSDALVPPPDISEDSFEWWFIQHYVELGWTFEWRLEARNVAIGALFPPVGTGVENRVYDFEVAIDDLAIDDTQRTLSLTCPAPAVIECGPDAETAIAAFLNGATAELTGGGEDDGVTVTTDAPSPLPLGVTTAVGFTATADGLTQSCTATVTYADSTPPQVVADPLGLDLTFILGEVVTLPAPAVTEACDAAPAVQSDAPQAFPVGATTVTVCATDATGLVGCDALVVTVITAAEAIGDLADAFGLTDRPGPGNGDGPGRRVLATLEAAMASLAAGRPHAALAQLDATRHKLAHGNVAVGWTAEEVDAFLAQLDRIVAAIQATL